MTYGQLRNNFDKTSSYVYLLMPKAQIRLPWLSSAGMPYVAFLFKSFVIPGLTRNLQSKTHYSLGLRIKPEMTVIIFSFINYLLTVYEFALQ
jgi:hypothetical protein